MALKIGNESLSLVKIGDELVNSIYIGNNLIYNHETKLYGWQIVGASFGTGFEYTQRVYTTEKMIDESTIFYDKWGIAFSRSKDEGGCAIWENNSLTVTAYNGSSYTALVTGIELSRVESDEVIIRDKSIQLYKWNDAKTTFSETGCLLTIDSYENGFVGNAYYPANTANGTTIRPSFITITNTETGVINYWLIYATGSDNKIGESGYGGELTRDTSGEDPIYYYKFQ